MLSLAMSGVVETIKLALTAVIAAYAFMALAEAVKRESSGDGKRQHGGR